VTFPHSRTGMPASDANQARLQGLLRFSSRPTTPPSAAPSRFAPRDVLRFPAGEGAPPAGGCAAARAAVAAELRRAEKLPVRLRQALAQACDNERPICTVGRLASMAGCDRRTLWNQWRNAVGREAPVRLEDFLHWQLLLRAVAMKQPDLAWADVADRLGVHPHTVARLARQLVGRTLRELSACSESTIATEFETKFLPHIFGAADKDEEAAAPARRAS
jgi:AraC-like DNA-binding protein